jgi:hypothetical protein
MSMHKAHEREFKAYLGCSLAELGLFGETTFHLKAAESNGGMREKCLSKVQKGGG